MKDITRVHLAKVAYDIEPDAKKELQQYVLKLETYVNDNDVIKDIEIRMTEILSDHAVKPGDVITMKDVTEIKEQLGQPVDFVETDTEMKDIPEVSDVARKRYFRDMDHGIFGGVLSGLASYFKINLTALRLIVIVLAFFSFGTVIVAYLVLWLLVPQAKSATQKLEMQGIQPTLEALRSYGADDTNTEQRIYRNTQIRRAVFITLGIGFVIAAFMTLIFTIGVAGGFSVGIEEILGDRNNEGFYAIAVGLMTLGGVLLSILLAMVAYCFIQMKVTKRIVIGSVVVIFLGLASFGSGVAAVAYQEWQREKQVQERVLVDRVAQTIDMTQVRNVVIDSHDTNIDYIVSDDEAKVEYKALPENMRPKLNLEGDVLTIKIDKNPNTISYQPTLTLYGPQLDGINAVSGVVSYTTSTQEKMSIDVLKNSFVTIQGVITDLTTMQRGHSSVSTRDAVVSSITSTLGDRDSLSIGNVRDVKLIVPAVCSGSGETVVDIAGSLNPVMVNDAVYNENTFNNACLTINLADD